MIIQIIIPLALASNNFCNFNKGQVFSFRVSPSSIWIVTYHTSNRHSPQFHQKHHHYDFILLYDMKTIRSTVALRLHNASSMYILGDLFISHSTSLTELPITYSIQLSYNMHIYQKDNFWRSHSSGNWPKWFTLFLQSTECLYNLPIMNYNSKLICIQKKNLKSLFDASITLRQGETRVTKIAEMNVKMPIPLLYWIQTYLGSTVRW